MSNNIYIAVAVPNSVEQKNPGDLCRETVSQLSRLVERSNLARYNNWTIPSGKLKVGTLDSLVGLSDELGKFDNTVRNNCLQIKKIYSDFSGKHEEVLLVKQMTPSAYLEGFQWDNKYSTESHLRDIVHEIVMETKTNLTNLLKIKASCVEVNRKLQVTTKKAEGNLTVRDFAQDVKHVDYINTESLATIFVVVHESQDQQFLDTYDKVQHSKEADRLRKFASDFHEREREKAAQLDEKAEVVETAKKPVVSETQRLRLAAAETMEKIKCPLVVPTSAKQIAKDSEFAMYRIVCLRKAKGVVELLLKEQRHHLRELSADWESPDIDLKEEQAQMQKTLKKQSKRLIAVCKTFYASTFVAWVHLKAVMMFVESVLRYGLPVRYTFCLIKPNRGQEKSIHKRLTEKYQILAHGAMSEKVKKKSKGTKDIDFTGMIKEYKPYVFTKLDLD